MKITTPATIVPMIIRSISCSCAVPISSECSDTTSATTMTCRSTWSTIGVYATKNLAQTLWTRSCSRPKIGISSQYARCPIPISVTRLIGGSSWKMIRINRNSTTTKRSMCRISVLILGSIREGDGYKIVSYIYLADYLQIVLYLDRCSL